jgi:putative transposase
MLANGGYAGADFQARLKVTCGVDLEIALHPRNKKGFVLVPMRRVVERTFAWLGCYRRLSIAHCSSVTSLG